MTGFDLLALLFVVVVALATLRDRDRDYGRIRRTERRTCQALFARTQEPPKPGTA